MGIVTLLFFVFFFNYTATTEIYTLSLHDALPICWGLEGLLVQACCSPRMNATSTDRSEEHTSELQSPCNLVCRLLLEKINASGELAVLPIRGHHVVAEQALIDYQRFNEVRRTPRKIFFFPQAPPPRKFPLFPNPTLST